MIKVKQSKAFTLVELLVSVAILLLVLGSAVSVEVQSIRLADTNQHALQAANLAQQQLNLVKTVRDNNIKDYPDPFEHFPTTGIKHLSCMLNKCTLGDLEERRTINGVVYTIQIRAWDAANL